MNWQCEALSVAIGCKSLGFCIFLTYCLCVFVWLVAGRSASVLLRTNTVSRLKKGKFV